MAHECGPFLQCREVDFVQMNLTRLLTALIGLAAFAGTTTVADAQETPAGTRVKLTVGQLFIPETFQLQDDKLDLVIHLHGAPTVVEKNLQQSRLNAVLVNVTLNGLSDVYKQQFSKPEIFATLLIETQDQVRQSRQLPNKPKINRVLVVSFSAGFGGVRELLKTDAIYERIDALVMADSIYAGYTPNTKPPEVDPGAMTGFLRFARDAAAGKKSLVISHCELRPETYASTAETADYLLHQLKLQRTPLDQEWEPGWKCLSECRQQGLQIYGFAGDTGKHHMQHLQNAGRLMKLTQPAVR